MRSRDIFFITFLLFLLTIDSVVAAPIDVLFQRFNPLLIGENCDFIIMLDTSGSMKRGGLFGQVKLTVSDFLDALEPGDYLSLIAFDTYPRYLLFPQTISADMSKLKDAILKLPAPTGQKTDIGAALESTVDELNRPRANRLQFVFFITDGKHEPPQGSKYQNIADKNWTLLCEKARRTRFDKLVSVTGLGLNEWTDIQLIKKVFPNALPLTVDKIGFANYFDRLKSEIKMRKLRLQVLDELNRGRIEIVPVSENKSRIHAGGKASFVFNLRSYYEHLDVAVRIEKSKISGDIHLESYVEPQDTFFELSPKSESPTLTLIVKDNRPNRRFSWRKIEKIKARVQFTLDITLKPEVALKKLNIEPRLKQLINPAEQAECGR